MKSPAFSYYEAKDLADAINIKKTDDDAVILAGGQSLLPTLNMRLSNPSVLIDIGNINELKKIKVEDSHLIIGAMCSHSQLMNDLVVNEKLPILNKILSQIAHPAIRNKGTHGGSIAYGDPAAELRSRAELYLLRPRSWECGPDRSRGEESGLRRAGRVLPVRGPRARKDGG